MKCQKFRPAMTYCSRLCVDCGELPQEHPAAAPAAQPEAAAVPAAWLAEAMALIVRDVCELDQPSDIEACDVLALYVDDLEEILLRHLAAAPTLETPALTVTTAAVAYLDALISGQGFSSIPVQVSELEVLRAIISTANAAPDGLQDEAIDMIEALRRGYKVDIGDGQYEPTPPTDQDVRAANLIARLLAAAPTAPAVAQVELPDEGELESWRKAADDLLFMSSRTARDAAIKLQNAYLFARSLESAAPAVAVPLLTDAEVDALLAAVNDVAMDADASAFGLPLVSRRDELRAAVREQIGARA